MASSDQNNQNLQSLLKEKAKLLIMRDRELQTIHQQSHFYRQWMEKTHKLTAMMSTISDPREALAQLIRCMVDDFGYEFSALIGSASFPMTGNNIPHPSDWTALADIAKQAITQSNVVIRHRSSSALQTHFAWVMGGNIRKQAGSPNAEFVLFVGRTDQTAIFYKAPSPDEVMLFQHLLDAVMHAYAAVKYRHDLVQERNNLEKNVEEATNQLRSMFEQEHLQRKELEILKERLSVTLRSIVDCVITSDSEGRIIFMNEAVERVLGWAPENLLGEFYLEKLFSENERGMARTLFQWAENGKIIHTEVTQQHKSMGLIPMELTLNVIKDLQGQTVGCVAVLRDLRELQRLRESLIRSEKMSAVGQLAAGVAHEINNPLGVILGFAQSLAHRLTPGDPLELPIKSISREAIRCKNLVQDLLTFSRATKTDQEAISINAAVEEALSLVLAKARIAKCEVKKELLPELPLILANVNQVQQIVINLANNAIDAMPKGGKLTVCTEFREDKPHPWVHLKISDTGTGIPKEILPHIFEPFFTTKPVGQGTGLGLSLVHEIVEKHSGTIDVRSEPGRTEFSILFPAWTEQQMKERMRAGQRENADKSMFDRYATGK